MDYEAVPKKSGSKLSSSIAFVLGIAIIYLMATNEYGDTDLVHEDLKVRSGFKLYIDYGTGCQYLSVGNLGTAIGLLPAHLVPRLDQDGKPMCLQPTNTEN
jgi:hypothetical protein